MNQHDMSGFGWAYYSHNEQRIKYPAGDLEPATLDGFMVLDSDLDNREFVRPGFVQVSKDWYDQQMQYIQRRDVNRAKKTMENREAKRNFASVPNIASAENRAALARKRQLEDEEFSENLRRQEARKRARSETVEEGEIRAHVGPMAPPPQPGGNAASSVGDGTAYPAALTTSNVASLPTSLASSSAVPTTVALSDIASVTGSMIHAEDLSTNLSPADLQLLQQADEYLNYSLDSQLEAPRTDVEMGQAQ
jgi:hypothetical protein